MKNQTDRDFDPESDGARATFDQKTGDLWIAWTGQDMPTDCVHHEWRHQAQEWCDKRGIKMSVV